MPQCTPPSLRDADWLMDPGLQHVLHTLDGASGRTCIVGGAVRNALMGQSVSDVDLATSLTPKEVMERATSSGFRIVSPGLAHGVLILQHGGQAYEVATLRKDVATDGRRASVVFTDDWAEDARRRDFSINALYANLNGDVFDPLGIGYPDILARRVRFIGDPVMRIAEDYLRVLRFFRFFAEYGQGVPDFDSLNACIAARGVLHNLSAERIRHELLRLLALPAPLSSITLMIETGLLHELLGGVTQTVSFSSYLSIESSWSLTIDPFRRLLFLACVVLEDAQRLRARLSLSNAEYARLSVASEAYRKFGSSVNDRNWKEILYRHGIGTYQDLVLMGLVYGNMSQELFWREQFSLSGTWPIPSLPWSGKDLISHGMIPGPKIGATLSDLEHSWILHDFPQDAEHLQRIFLNICGEHEKQMDGCKKQ